MGEYNVYPQDILKKEVEKHDIIIPLAAIVGAPACDRDKPLATALNQTQIENIAKWVSTDQMVLYPVTNSGYGVGQKGIYCDEKTLLNPISLYGGLDKFFPSSSSSDERINAKALRNKKIP